MDKKNKGIHHISIIAGDPSVNADFYTRILGLRMVLKTVNQDDPGTYHLFYANGQGRPGSSITFFPWPMAKKGKAGTGQNTQIGFVVPKSSEEFWKIRFSTYDIAYEELTRFGHDLVRFEDPDGLTLELVFDESVKNVPGWKTQDIAEEYSIRGFWSATLKLSSAAKTVEILENIAGFEKADQEDNLTLYKTGSDIGNHIIIEETGKSEPTENGRGIVHHIAFRAKNEEELREMRQKALQYNVSPTQLIDRHVFKSVYFMTPGGVLFELASDDPGYKSVVEDESQMGKDLFLPPWLEPKRERIESVLPSLNSP